jgi:hypothetical protein
VASVWKILWNNFFQNGPLINIKIYLGMLVTYSNFTKLGEKKPLVTTSAILKCVVVL